MTKRIITIVLLFIIIGLSACGNSVAPPNSSESDTSIPAPVESSPQKQVSQISDVFYPISGGWHKTWWTWLEEGTLLAVQDYGNIRYIDLNNQLVSELTIPEHILTGDYRISIADNRIFVSGGGAARRRSDIPDRRPESLAVCKVGDEWILVNGSIWDSDGNLIREFLQYDSILNAFGSEIGRELSDGREVEISISMYRDSAEPPVWVNDDLVAINFYSRLFFYRISTDTLTLAVDISEWMNNLSSGIMHVYYGIAYIMPTENGVFYFAHKDEEKASTVGTVWYADETGSQVLFDGQQFSYVLNYDGMLLMGETHTTMNNTKLWYATDDDWTLRELVFWDWRHMPRRPNNGYFTFIRSYIPYTFHAIDALDASIISSHNPQIESNQYSILGIRKIGDFLQYIYAAWIDGDYYFYIYDEGTGITRELNELPFTFLNNGLNQSLTHFVELYPSGWRITIDDATGIRVREIN